MKNLNVDELQGLFYGDGFVFLQRFFKEEKMIEIKSHIDDFLREKISSMPPNYYFYEEDKNLSSIKQVKDIDKFDKYFKDLIKTGGFEELAELLLKEKVICKTVEYFNKLPGKSRPTPPHQDGYYFMIEPQNALTVWVPLENVDEENGCLHYIKGSNKLGMRNHRRAYTLGFSQEIEDFGIEEDLKNEISCPVNIGDILVHHSLTIHRASANSSGNRTRKAIGFIFFGVSAKEDLEAKKAYQKRLESENVN